MLARVFFTFGCGFYKYRAEYPRMIESKVWEYAFEEVVAESCETLLRDGRLLEKLQTKAMKNQNWVKKCISWIKEFLQDIMRLMLTSTPIPRKENW